MASRILVVGATGLLGEAVARGLREAGFSVRSMSRKVDGAADQLDDSFEVFAGDALRRTDVERALEGCDGVHVSVDHEREDACVFRIVEAARALGLRRITYVSGVTVCEGNGWFPVVARKLRAEEAVREGGLEFTIFRPGWFMEMLARFVRNGRAFVFGRPTRRWHFVAVDEFARMVVESHRRPEAIGKCLYVHGPQALTVTEALGTYCRVLHPEIGGIRRLPCWLVRLVAAMTRNDELRSGVELTAYLERVGERGDPSEANSLLGAPRTTLEEWLGARKAA